MKNHTPSILLIEDDPIISKLIEHRLTKNKYRLEQRNNGMDGLNAIKEMNPDLVLLDVMLPSINGLELLRQIRSDEQLKDTKVVILSASMKMRDKKRAFNYQAKDYVVKPFQTDELLLRINKALLN